MKRLVLALLLVPTLAHADPPAAVPAPVVVAPAPEIAPLPRVESGQLVDACTACARGVVQTIAPSAWDKHSKWIVPVISIIGGGLATVQAMAAAGVFRGQ